MSYQPDPPAGAGPTSPFGVPAAVPPPPPVAQQYSYGDAPATFAAAPAAPATRKRRKGLLFTGLAIAVVGIAAGVVLVALSGSAREETVQGFARAPVGCTTTLEFDKRATFTIYIETQGSIGSVAGDCTAGDTTYRRGGDDLPLVSLTLLDGADKESNMLPADAPAYSVTGFAGQAIQRVQITEPGTYRLTVTSDDTDFAIAVGGNPDKDAHAMILAGVGAALFGVLLGGLVILLGMRRGKMAPLAAPAAAPHAVWQPTPAASSAYPTTSTPTPTATATATTTPTPTAGPGWGAPQP